MSHHLSNQADSISKQLKEELTSITGAIVKEDLAFSIETERAEQMTISRLFYKVPVGPLTTLNFTASPFEQISNSKKTKDKKKAKLPKVRKQKRMRFCEIPKNRGPSALISFAGSELLAAHVAQQYGTELQAKYGLNPNLNCTERILEYDESINSFIYLDHLRDIEDDLIRAEPLLTKWETAVLAKKKKYEKESGKKFDSVPRRPEAPKKDDPKYATDNEEKKKKSQEMMSKVPVKERMDIVIVDCTAKRSVSHLQWPWESLLEGPAIMDESEPFVTTTEPQKTFATPKAGIMTPASAQQDGLEMVVIEPEVFYKKPKFSLTCEVSTQVDISVRVEETVNLGEARWEEVLEYQRQNQIIKGEIDRNQRLNQRNGLKFRPEGVKTYYIITDPTCGKKIVVGAHYYDGFMVNGTINYDSEQQIIGEWRDPSLFQVAPQHRDGIVFN